MGSHWTEDLKSSYGQLLSLMEQQAALLQHSDQELSLKQFTSTALEWSLISGRIDKLIDDHGGYDRLEESDRQEVIDLLHRMTEIGQLLEASLEKQYRDDSDTMKRVKMQQTTLRSYGGLGFQDSVALYVDEKQ